VGFVVSVNLSVSRGNREEQWDWSDDPLNFSESEWWGRITEIDLVLMVK